MKKPRNTMPLVAAITVLCLTVAAVVYLNVREDRIKKERAANYNDLSAQIDAFAEGKP